jgi:Lsr2
VNAARRVGGSARRPARGSRRGPVGGLDTTEIHEWAWAQGIEVKDRGRVPADLMVKFKADTGQG